MKRAGVRVGVGTRFTYDGEILDFRSYAAAAAQASS